MASRAFAYNTGSSINGTEQLGNLAIQTTFQDYSSNPGSVKWWNGPDEDLGYVIAQSVPGNTQPTPVSGVSASVGFFRSSALTDPSFINIADTIAGPSGPFASASNAKTWLNANGYWTSYTSSQATITFSFTNNAGAVSLAINVTSGTILDNIGYYGSVRGWTNLGCNIGQTSPDQFFNNTLFGPPSTAPGTSSQIWGSGSAILSASLMSLLINNIPINTPDEYITYNGHVYRIIGFGTCQTVI